MGTVAKVVLLIAGAIVGVGAGVAVVSWAGWGSGEGDLLPAAVATVLCLVPAAATLVFADGVFRSAPQFGPVAVMVGTGVRMAVAVVGVFLFAEAVEKAGTPRDRFANWVAYSYIVTLTLECGLLAAGLTRQNSPVPEKVTP